MINQRADQGRDTRAPFPEREAGSALPLILAADAYPALERMVLDAQHEALFGFRIFDPDTRLRSDEALAAGLESWGDLLADALRRGVRIRILLTDFSPIAAITLHKKTWKSVRAWQKAADIVENGDQFGIIAARHEGEAGPVARWVFWPLVRLKLERSLRAAREDHGVERDLKKNAPGLRHLLRGRGDDLTAEWFSPIRLFPATYHQKFAVIDGARAVVGGLDINERRYDAPDHARPAEETWHDVSLAVEGPVADDVREHFVQCWNRETPRFNARLTRLGAPSDDLPHPVHPLDHAAPAAATGPSARTTVTPPTVRLVRTRSRRSRSPFAFGPTPDITEIEAAHVEQAERCERFLYIETQFFRSLALARKLAAQGLRKPDMRLVLVVPAAPEDVVFDGSDAPDARHGEWLQVRAIDELREGFGSRLLLLSLAKDLATRPTEDRQTIAGRPIIYVHAKVAIADARTAIVSSANLNARSLQWDTELGLVWTDPAEVRNFQDRLWSLHLRDGFDASVDPTGAEAFAMWTAASDTKPDDADAAPMVAPYPLESARAFARRWRTIPDALL